MYFPLRYTPFSLKKISGVFLGGSPVLKKPFISISGRDSSLTIQTSTLVLCVFFFHGNHGPSFSTIIFQQNQLIPPPSNMSTTNDQGLWEIDEETLNSGACG